MAVLVEVLEERSLGTRTVGALNARAVSQAPTAGLIASLIATRSPLRRRHGLV